MTIMVGVILVSYLLCTLPAIVVQELHSRGRSFDRVRKQFDIFPIYSQKLICQTWTQGWGGRLLLD